LGTKLNKIVFPRDFFNQSPKKVIFMGYKTSRFYKIPQKKHILDFWKHKKVYLYGIQNK
jgi:hypothetical protein